MTQGILDFLSLSRERCEQQLSSLLTAHDIPSAKLREAVQYSLLGSGKRIRPALVYAAAQACEELNQSADYFACALEAIHCYSLVHDDLPAMDDDDLRRGKATNHKVFGEAMAILAGDLLQSLAFEWLNCAALAPAQLLEAHSVLAGGASLMVSGQALDIDAANTSSNIEELEIIHRNKTGALIEASLRLGGLAAEGNARQHTALARYGKLIGLAFQVKDDILDVEADTATLGKQQGADLNLNKPTYVSLMGLDKAKTYANNLHTEALEALNEFGDSADTLRQLAEYIVNRQY